ncbi:hypothetical protein [Moritella sp. 5]|uniref:hypothetical protein n=1 Tax=Moritella sp. 5 TaxID=2746231 RepID=UPI001BAAE21C|nr:hypothetical protein [Moritella sp. 5]
MGGAQNPSVIVTADEEGTYTVDLFLSYADGDPVQGATYSLVDQAGAAFEGSLGNDGKVAVGGVAPGAFTIEYGEDSREFKPNEPTKVNPKFDGQANAQTIIEDTKRGEVGFWESTWRKASNGGTWIWGVILGDFNDDASVEQIIANAALTMIPVVDQVGDIRDLTANILNMMDEEGRDKPENWLALSFTLIGCIPLFGSALKGTCKVVLKTGKETKKDDLLAIVRAFGKGDPEKFLLGLDWGQYAKDISKILSNVLKPCVEIATEMASYADELASQFLKLGDEIKIFDKMSVDKLKSAMGEFDDLFARVLGKSEKVYPAKTKHHTGGTAQAGSNKTKANEKKDKKDIRCKVCRRLAGKKKGQCKEALIM